MSDTNKELLSESEIVLALNEEFGNEMAYMNFEMDMRHARAIERAVLEKIALAPGLSGWQEIASANAVEKLRHALVRIAKETSSDYIGNIAENALLQLKGTIEGNDAPPVFAHRNGVKTHERKAEDSNRSACRQGDESEGAASSDATGTSGAELGAGSRGDEDGRLVTSGLHSEQVQAAPHQPQPDPDATQARCGLCHGLGAEHAQGCPAQPQPEPTSKGVEDELRESVDSLRRALEIIAVGDSQDPVRDAGDELVALGYWSAEAVAQYRAAHASQQRETQEAAEFSVRLSEFAIAAHRGESARMAVLADVLKSMFEAHVSATQEAGKAEGECPGCGGLGRIRVLRCEQCDGTGKILPSPSKEAGKAVTIQFTKAPCLRCGKPTIKHICSDCDEKEAGKVEAVADEPLRWNISSGGYRFFRADGSEVHPSETPLYLRPSQQALISDETIESFVVEKLGTPDSFPAGEYYSGTMEKMVELARTILAAAGGSEK